uniref:Uncharacterized protein n=1 Tax=Anguilla anguilla TaxID=7936 RepID=A0A0E9U9T7_ANGAN
MSVCTGYSTKAMGYPQATVVNSSVRIFLQADNHWHTVHTIKFKGKKKAVSGK